MRIKFDTQRESAKIRSRSLKRCVFLGTCAALLLVAFSGAHLAWPQERSPYNWNMIPSTPFKSQRSIRTHSSFMEARHCEALADQFNRASEGKTESQDLQDAEALYDLGVSLCKRGARDQGIDYLDRALTATTHTQ